MPSERMPQEEEPMNLNVEDIDKLPPTRHTLEMITQILKDEMAKPHNERDRGYENHLRGKLNTLSQDFDTNADQ